MISTENPIHCPQTPVMPPEICPKECTIMTKISPKDLISCNLQFRLLVWWVSQADQKVEAEIKLFSPRLLNSLLLIVASLQIGFFVLSKLRRYTYDDSCLLNYLTGSQGTSIDYLMRTLPFVYLSTVRLVCIILVLLHSAYVDWSEHKGSTLMCWILQGDHQWRSSNLLERAKTFLSSLGSSLSMWWCNEKVFIMLGSFIISECCCMTLHALFDNYVQTLIPEMWHHSRRDLPNCIYTKQASKPSLLSVRLPYKVFAKIEWQRDHADNLSSFCWRCLMFCSQTF